MSTATGVATPSPSTSRLPKLLTLGAILAVAAYFVYRYVFHYYLNFNPSGFQQYWPYRATLMLHITGGMVALLIGPFQFSRRIRQRYLSLHRNLGRTYLIAVLFAACASLRLAFNVSPLFSLVWAASLVGLALAWLTTSGMAYYAIRKRQVAIHKEWMIRSYIVTSGFVTFRLFNDFGPLSHIQPVADRAATIVWACWVLPLLAYEVIQSLLRIRRASA